MRHVKRKESQRIPDTVNVAIFLALTLTAWGILGLCLFAIYKGAGLILG